jgi:hypothetical protein
LVPLLLLASAVLFLVACGTSSPSETSPAGGPTGEAAVGPGTVPPESVVAVTFANDSLAPETIRVKQGDSVTLNLSSDRPGSFHIHGYDLQQEVVVGEVTPFQFLADATGRFGINFHGAPEPELGMPAASGEESGSSGMGGHSGSGGSKDQGPAESSVPVMLDIAAEVDDNGGVHVAIKTEGWRWAPEEVNGANSEGAGHAHIYADGVKLSRVYGEYHYLPALEPGNREIQVYLNTNDHGELAWQGSKLVSGVALVVPETPVTGPSEADHLPEPVNADAPMSVEVVVHEDALGGYNLQVTPQGFGFSQSLGQEHQPGKGYAQLSIDGEVFNRMYVPWLQVPAQGEGMHTFTVTLLNDEGRPYEYNGQPAQMSAMVHEEAEADDGDAATAGHHDSGPDAAAGAATEHQHTGDSDHDHGADQTSGIVEMEVGYLEVLP